jgi:putative Mg2+ transporter-C (MgtC) family protein
MHLITSLPEEILKIFLALLAGCMLGFEREYKTKAAGLRTIALICTGSALFTVMSQHIGLNGNPDRIASNIVTGIGFIGAGVIFKSELSVSGLTTAATIWIAAAIGVAIGGGAYGLAFASLGAALFILLVLRLMQARISNFHQIRVYKLSFQLDNLTNKELENVFKEFNIEYRKLKEYRTTLETTCVYQLAGRVTQLERMNDHLMNLKLIDSFAY